MQKIFERLVAANIQILPAFQIQNHVVFERNGLVALVARYADRFGSIGAAGILTDKGFMPLVWRGEEAFFVFKAHEARASAERVAELKQFQSDLESALK